MLVVEKVPPLLVRPVGSQEGEELFQRLNVDSVPRHLIHEEYITLASLSISGKRARRDPLSPPENDLPNAKSLKGRDPQANYYM